MKGLTDYKAELENTLRNHIIPFWLGRSIDSEFGGYLTSFDDHGIFDGNGVKNIVTQSRMVWGFSHLYKYAADNDRSAMKDAAHHGMRFLIDKFWDNKFGGFYWLLNRDGSIKDGAKLTYGESFAMYALSEYYLVFRNPEALIYAELVFDYLQKYATDTLNGGYFENIERDWTISPSGQNAGDRKSLDIHMHLLEAYTTLYKATNKEIHKRKLQEVYNLIKAHMVHMEKGYGYNQFDASFKKLPAINIPRTWNAERETNEILDIPADTTSYGHNVELSWLADLALCTIGSRKEEDTKLLMKLLDHALDFGYDNEFGGVYRDGIADQKAVILDKEWWQNFESMAGFLNGYRNYSDQRYLDAFIQIWSFIKAHFMDYEIGESRQLLNRKGQPIVANLGNPWKGIYHTGRALAECIDHLSVCISKE